MRLVERSLTIARIDERNAFRRRAAIGNEPLPDRPIGLSSVPGRVENVHSGTRVDGAVSSQFANSLGLVSPVGRLRRP